MKEYFTGLISISFFTYKYSETASKEASILRLFWFQSNSGEDMDWEMCAIIGTSQNLEKPYLRLTSVSEQLQLLYKL